MSGRTSPDSSQSLSVISAMTRKSVSVTMPKALMNRCDRPNQPVTSSTLRITAATSMAPM